VSNTGELFAQNATINTGIDYAEAFEWKDGNPKSEDRVGLFVELSGDKISIAREGSEYIGIVSATPNVVGDEGAMNWKDKYLKDDFGRVIYEDIKDASKEITADQKARLAKLRKADNLTDKQKKALERLEEIENRPCPIISAPKLNPEYDPNKEYILRKDRKEWDNIGLLGQLRVKDDNTAKAGDRVLPTKGGIATKSSTGKGYKVIKRIKKGIVQVLVK